MKKIFALGAALFLACTPLYADLLPPETATVTNTDAIFDAKTKSADELALRLEALKTYLADHPSADEKMIDRVQELVVTYSRLSGEANAAKAAESDLQALKATPPTPLGDGPFSLTEYDTQQAKLSDLKAQHDVAKSAYSSASLSLDLADKKVKDAEVAFRAWRDSHNEADEPLPRALLALDVEKSRAEAQLWRTSRAAADSLQQKILLMLDRQKTTLKAMAENLAADSASLEAYFEGKKAAIDEANHAIAQRAAKAQEDLAALVEPRDSGDKRSNELSRGLWVQQRSELTSLLDALGEESSRLMAHKELLDLRHKALSNQLNEQSTTLHQSIETLKKQAATAGEALTAANQSAQALKSRMTTLQTALSGASDAQEQEVLRATIDSLRRQQETAFEAANSALNLQQATEELLSELSARYDSINVTDRVTGLWKEKVLGVLNTELWSSGDYTIRLRSLLAALVLLILGALISRRLAHRFVDRLGRRLNLDGTTVALMKRFTFYILLFICFLIALRLVGIPLTAFAFLGGAFAIAVGLGAQNLFNNLISGIVLAAHKPFRIDDVVEVEGVTAVVKHLGSRSTQLRTFDGKDVILPNSKLMDSKLINWSLSDKQFRGTIEIGLSYDCDPRRASELMIEVVKAHPHVLSDPEPYVLFTNFGSSSLDFTIYFWVDTRVAGAAVVGSDLRYSLFEVLGREKIGIPYPQMDLHLPTPPEGWFGQK